jgi:HEAT repeat protein
LIGGRIADRVVAMVGDESRSAASRTSALQACVALGEKGALPSARKLLRSEHRPLSVSAIACLGALGTDDDLPILLAISNESDDLRRNAADKAVAKLGRRIGSKRRGEPQ